MTKKLIISLLPFLLIGCAARSVDTVTPHHLQSSPRHIIEGRQGWMPGSELKFSSFEAQVDKGWITGSSTNFLSGLFVNESKTQEVSILQSGPDQVIASFDYWQQCSAQGTRFPITDWLEYDDVETIHEFEGVVQIGGQQAKKTWYFFDNALYDDQGNHLVIERNEISYNGEIVAEYQLNVYMGGLSNRDFIWLDDHQPTDIQLLTALLASYDMTFQPLNCDEDDSITVF